jgi:hypothetical protein
LKKERKWRNKDHIKAKTEGRTNEGERSVCRSDDEGFRDDLISGARSAGSREIRLDTREGSVDVDVDADMVLGG